jgi:hypothetical protein
VTKLAEPIQTDEEQEQFPPVMDDAGRRRYEEACRFFDEHLASLAKEAEDAEMLTKDDFAIRINAK